MATTDGPITHTLYFPLVTNTQEETDPTLFGVQMYGGLTGESAGLTHVDDARVSWARWPIAWSSVEPTDRVPADYVFDHYDASIQRAVDAGLNLIVTIQGNPGWAATYRNGPIDKVDIGEFTEFVGTLVERYDGDDRDDAPGSPVVNYWEFYNEPDAGSRLRAEWGMSYWGHFGREYARMLCAVYPVIKAANPQARVVLGGLAYDWFEENDGPFVREFLDDVLAAGGGDCFDVMNFHYYTPFASTWSSYGQGIIGKASYLRSKLEAYGVHDKPMITTEAGKPNNSGNSDEVQSRYVVKLFSRSMAVPLEITIWWTWIDPAPPYDANGLMTRELQRKPAFYVYQTTAEKLGHAQYQRRLSSTELGVSTVEGYQFEDTTSNVLLLYTLWSNDSETYDISLVIPEGGTVEVTDMYGDHSDYISDHADGQVDGSVLIPVGPNPIFVEVSP